MRLIHIHVLSVECLPSSSCLGLCVLTFGPHLAALRDHFCRGPGDPYVVPGIAPESAVSKVSVNPLSYLWSQPMVTVDGDNNDSQ